jgi:hypothetical protein
LFALCVGVVNDAGETRARTCRRPLQHLQVAIGVAERKNRAPAE